MRGKKVYWKLKKTLFTNLIISAALIFTASTAESALSDHCSYPSTRDTFTESPTGYLVKATDWNEVQCALDAIETQLDITGSFAFLQDTEGTVGINQLNDGALSSTTVNYVVTVASGGTTFSYKLIGRDNIDETLLSIQTHATNCAALSCIAADDGELCWEDDDDSLYVCEAGTWTVLSGGGGGTECASEACSLNSSTTHNGSVISTGAHTALYVDADAVAAMGAKDNGNALNHDRNALVVGSSGTDAMAGDTVTITGAESTAIAANTLKVTNVSTNLSVTKSGSALTVVSSDGSNASLPLADTTNWGVMSDEMFDKLDTIEDGATANDTNANLLARTNHTGTQAASTISDFDTEVGNNTAVTANTAKDTNVSTNLSVSRDGTKLHVVSSDGSNAALPLANTTQWGVMSDEMFDAQTANTAKVTNATHTGDVTGAGALTIVDKKVTLSKMADMATDSLIGRNTASAGVPEILSAATARTILNIENGATADQTDAEIKGAMGAINDSNPYHHNRNAYADADAVSAVATADDYVSNEGDIMTGELTLNNSVTGRQLILNDISGTGSPYMEFKQNGTRRSFIQHNDGGDTFIIASEFGDISFRTDDANAETQKMVIKDTGDINMNPANGIVTMGISDNTRNLLYMYGNGAGSDYGGEILFFAPDDHDDSTNFHFIQAYTDHLRFGTPGVGNHLFGADADVTFNETGNAGGDFRIESTTNPNMFFLDAGLNRVGIGEGIPDADGLHVTGGATGAAVLKLERLSPNAIIQANMSSGDPQFVFTDADTGDFAIGVDDSTNTFQISHGIYIGYSPSNNVILEADATSVDITGGFNVSGNSTLTGWVKADSYYDPDGSNQLDLDDDNLAGEPISANGVNLNSLGSIYMLLDDNNNNGDAAVFQVGEGSADATVASDLFKVVGDGQVIANDDGLATGDFRVESDTNENMLFVDAGTNRVGVNTSAPDSKLHVKGTDDTGPATQGLLTLGDLTLTNLSLDQNEIMARNNGVAATLYLQNEGGNVISNAAWVFNNNEANKDLRIAGDAETNLFFIDASTDRIGIGTSTPEAAFTLHLKNTSTLADNTVENIFRIINDGGGDAGISFGVETDTNPVTLTEPTEFSIGIDRDGPDTSVITDDYMFKITHGKTFGPQCKYGVNKGKSCSSSETCKVCMGTCVSDSTAISNGNENVGDPCYDDSHCFDYTLENKVKNPDMESAASTTSAEGKWRANPTDGDVVISLDTSQLHQGNTSFKVEREANTGYTRVYQSLLATTGNVSPLDEDGIIISGGKAVYASGWFKAVGTAVGDSVHLTLLESGGVGIDQETASKSITSTGDWQKIEISGLILQGDRTVLQVYFGLTNTSVTGDIIYVDDVYVGNTAEQGKCDNTNTVCSTASNNCIGSCAGGTNSGNECDEDSDCPSSTCSSRVTCITTASTNGLVSCDKSNTITGTAVFGEDCSVSNGCDAGGGDLVCSAGPDLGCNLLADKLTIDSTGQMTLAGLDPTDYVFSVVASGLACNPNRVCNSNGLCETEEYTTCTADEDCQSGSCLGTTFCAPLVSNTVCNYDSDCTSADCGVGSTCQAISNFSDASINDLVDNEQAIVPENGKCEDNGGSKEDNSCQIDNQCDVGKCRYSGIGCHADSGCDPGRCTTNVTCTVAASANDASNVSCAAIGNTNIQGSDTITVDDNDFSDGDIVELQGTCSTTITTICDKDADCPTGETCQVPEGLELETGYFVVNSTSNSFQLMYTAGDDESSGDLVDITGLTACSGLVINLPQYECGDVGPGVCKEDLTCEGFSCRTDSDCAVNNTDNFVSACVAPENSGWVVDKAETCGDKRYISSVATPTITLGVCEDTDPLIPAPSHTAGDCAAGSCGGCVTEDACDASSAACTWNNKHDWSNNDPVKFNGIITGLDSGNLYYACNVNQVNGTLQLKSASDCSGSAIALDNSVCTAGNCNSTRLTRDFLAECIDTANNVPESLNVCVGSAVQGFYNANKQTIAYMGITEKGNFAIAATPDLTLNPWFHIQGSTERDTGFVGLGTTFPKSQLDVRGNVTTDGLYIRGSCTGVLDTELESPFNPTYDYDLAALGQCGVAKDCTGCTSKDMCTAASSFGKHCDGGLSGLTDFDKPCTTTAECAAAGDSCIEKHSCKDLIPLQVKNIFIDNNCIGCHQSSSGGLTLTGVNDGNNLINVHPSCGDTNDPLIAPGDPDGSYLYQKLTQSLVACGFQMPSYGTLLSQADIDTIYNWITSLAEFSDASCETGCAWDTGKGRLGVGTNTPEAAIDVQGDAIFRGQLNFSNPASSSLGQVRQDSEALHIHTTSSQIHLVPDLDLGHNPYMTVQIAKRCTDSFADCSVASCASGTCTEFAEIVTTAAGTLGTREERVNGVLTEHVDISKTLKVNDPQFAVVQGDKEKWTGFIWGSCDDGDYSIRGTCNNSGNTWTTNSSSISNGGVNVQLNGTTYACQITGCGAGCNVTQAATNLDCTVASGFSTDWVKSTGAGTSQVFFEAVELGDKVTGAFSLESTSGTSNVGWYGNDILGVTLFQELVDGGSGTDSVTITGNLVLTGGTADITGPLDVTGAVTATGAVTGGSLTTAGAVTGGSFGDVTGDSLNVTGTVTGGALTTAGNISSSGSGTISTGGAVVGTTAVATGGQLSGGSLSVSGAATVGSLTTVGDVSAANIDANFVRLGITTIDIGNDCGDDGTPAFVSLENITSSYVRIKHSDGQGSGCKIKDIYCTGGGVGNSQCEFGTLLTIHTVNDNDDVTFQQGGTCGAGGTCISMCQAAGCDGVNERKLDSNQDTIQFLYQGMSNGGRWVELSYTDNE